MCASRGCAASACIARPCGVMRPLRVERAEPQQAGRARRRASRRAARRASAARRRPCPRRRGRARAAPSRRRRSPASRIRGEAAVGALAPQPIADAGRRAAGAARALLGRRARDALRLEPAHAADGIEHAAPLEPRIDDDAHAVDREARLGDVRREHDLAPARACRRERRVLLARRELAVQRQHVDVGAERESSRSRRCTRRISPAPGRNTSRSPVASASARCDGARRDARRRARAPPGRTGKPLPV